MLHIGLTGGIGSGKTTVLRMFEKLGMSTYIADVAAKRLMNDSSELKSKIIEEFGSASYVDGKLNRPYLAELVFKDSKKLNDTGTRDKFIRKSLSKTGRVFYQVYQQSTKRISKNKKERTFLFSATKRKRK